MINTDSLGERLTASFTSHFQNKSLDVDKGPKEQIYFARKIGNAWVRRDVTDVFFQASPISKHIAQNYGTSNGAEVSLVFDNSAFPVIYPIQSDASGRIYEFAVAFEPDVTRDRGAETYPLRRNDWIEISDYDNIEQRRILFVSPISDTDNTLYRIRISEPLDNTFNVDYMEVRYLFSITGTDKNRLESFDLYNGYIQMNLGFNDESSYVTLYQGEVIGGQRDPNSTVTLTTQDRVKNLVETQLASRFEVDDRGVASVPTPRGYNGENNRKDSVIPDVFDIADIPNDPNIGTGEASDIAYNENKIGEITFTDEWVITFDGEDERWHVRGVGYGTDELLGYRSEGIIGSRAWTINESERHGWSISINEGSIPFAHGDQFVFYTKAYREDMCHIVKGRGFANSPIETLDIKYLNPSYVIEYFVVDVLGISHEKVNVRNGDETPVFTNIQDIRKEDLDFRTELRGIFQEGTSAIEVIDDALRAVNGWLYSTHDDHLSVFFYSPFLFGDYDTTRIQTDFDNPRISSRYPNAADPQVEPRMVDSIKNQMSFQFANGEVFVDDPDSQANFGVFKLDVRGEDLITHQISSGYEMSENTARNASHRALQRYKNPIFRGRFVGMPDLLLLEIGDIPIVYSRESQFVNRPLWVTGIEIDFVNLIIMVQGELATQIDGKFGVAHEIVTDTDTTPGPNDLWNVTGFIGDIGEERLAFVADEDEQLATLIGSTTYSPRIGKPDRWGNFAADAFIVA